jgi:hypothetical protein
MDKSDDAREGEDDGLRDASEADAATAEGGADGFDVEHEGQVYRLPEALRGGFLRQADYTRKTQELAEHRRALETERADAAAMAQAAHGALSDRAHLAALDQQLAGFQSVGWRALEQHDPERAHVLQQQAQQTLALREHYAQAVALHVSHARIQAAQEAAARMAQTGRILSREIDGWSPELAGKLVDYAQGHGVTLDELGAADDPRVWKILHRAWQGDQAGQREDAAKAAAQAQAVRPAVTVSGAAASGGGVRDELATKEWMKRRNEALRRGR